MLKESGEEEYQKEVGGCNKQWYEMDRWCKWRGCGRLGYVEMED